VTVFGASALQARQDAKKVLDNYREPLLAASLDHLEDAGRKRLSKLQQLLVELVRRLDDQQKRYLFELKKAGVGALSATSAPAPPSVAQAEATSSEWRRA
jgi:hypothetical protein